SGFLSRIGKQKLSSYLSKEINIDLHKVLSIFEEEINEMNIIFVIDDFERAEGEILWLFSSFFSIAEKLKNTKFIIITRDLIRFYTQIDIKTKKLVVELQITGLDFENSRKLILSRSPGKWNDISLLNIHKLTAGHPFYLELIERENENVETDFWSFMSKEVFARLTESEANLLGIASVFRTPVSADALFVEDWVNYETIEKLVSKSLLREPYPQTYEIYNQISDFFYSRLPPTKKKKCHVYAADYYLKMVDDLSIIEAIYHLIRSDEQKKAAKLLGERGLSLLKKGYLEELNSLIKELDERKINDEDARRITTMRNDILDIWGRWDNIFEYRRQSLFLASRLKKDIKREILLEKIGYVLWKKHEFDEGICNLMKSARTLEKIGDKEGLAEINRNIGWIFWLKNEKDKAVEYYSEASKIAKRVNNLNIMKRINFECGHIYCESGDFEKSLANYEAAIKIANSKNDVHDLVRGYDYIANLYMNKNDLENAFGYLEKSSATAERVLFSSGKAYSLLHLSDYWFDKKKFDAAGKCLEESIKLFNKLNDRLGICYVHSHFGILYKYNNEIEKSINSFKAAVSNIKQSEFPYYVEELNDEIARLSKLVDVRIWKK
ncbi:MAG: tetratricopeptide repeat protein, partial [Candidatus Thermoplasmatota archaeon]